MTSQSSSRWSFLDAERWTARTEIFVVAGLLLLVYGCLLHRLGAVVVSDMDEGTYLYAGKLVAEGRTPYRDFLLVHPPLLVYVAAGWIKLFGANLMAARLGYMFVILAAMVPLYLITRNVSGSRLGGLLGVVLCTTGMLFLANMGRTVRLEPLTNAFLIAAIGCWTLRARSMVWNFLGGVLAGLAMLVKLVAVIPVAFFVLGALIWQRDRARLIALGAAAVGGALVVIPAAIWLLGEPGFVDAVFKSQVNRPSIGLFTKLSFVRQDVFRFPVLAIGWILAAWSLVRGKDPSERTLALVVLGGSLTLIFGFKTFFGYYLVLVVPWVAVLVAGYAPLLARRWLRSWWQPALAASIVLLGAAGTLAYAEVYFRKGHGHVSSPARIVAELHGRSGYMYSMYPSFSLAADRELYPWFNIVDSLIPRITGTLRDEDLIRVFSGSEDLVLWSGELAPYGKADAYVRSNFDVVYQDDYYALWTRRKTR